MNDTNRLNREREDMESKRKQEILVYGAGNFFCANKQKIERDYNIKMIIDKNKEGFVDNWKIIKIEECANIVYEKIIIMVENIRDCFLIIGDLLNAGIANSRIVWGGSIYGKYADKYDEIVILSNGKMCVDKNGIKVEVASADEFYNVYETLIEECYCYRINNGKKDIVLDVGMNVGDAVLYFLKDENVEKVYAFEPFQKTFMSAEKNLKEYLKDSSRLEIFQYGLSDVTEDREIVFNEDMTCGLSTQTLKNPDSYNVYEFYYNNGLADQQKEYIEKISVKNAADVLIPIIDKYKQYNNIVLKMDCEGEEYRIIELLRKENVLSQIDFIMLEWHYQGKESILQKLSQAGFSYLCSEQKDNMGHVCAWHNVI